MFGLILLITFSTVLFCILIEFENNTLYKRNCISSSVLYSFLVNSMVFLTIYYFPYYVILLVCGFFIILKGFSYLAIIDFKILRDINPFTVLSFLVSVVIATSKLSLESSIFILLFFYFMFFVLSPVLNTSRLNKTKRSEILTILLELNRVITGIFMFILGLVITANRIPFLEKMADKFF